MKTKVWNYAPDRDDCVVQTEESVVFENEHVGWFVANPDPNGRRRLDNMGGCGTGRRCCLSGLFQQPECFDTRISRCCER